ncbi:MAG: hypothetical protein HRU12_04510 [Phaeodactylibacter sp.]|nr:hypothetical protein [Phaeodactylibacter sp.]
MKRFLSLFLFIWLSWQYLPAQNQQPIKWGIHATPSGLLNFYPRFRIGTQAIKGKHGILLDLAYANFPSFWNESSFRRGYNYVAVRPEFRWFNAPFNGSKGMLSSDYIGLELVLAQLLVDVEDNAFEAMDGEQYSFDEATKQRRQISAHLTFGLQRADQGRAYLNLYAGAGVRVQHIQYINVSNPVLRFDQPAEGWIINFERRREGWSIIPSLTLGLRLGLGL